MMETHAVASSDTARIVYFDVARGVRAHTPLRVLQRVLKSEQLFDEWKVVAAQNTAIRPLTLNLARYVGHVVPSAPGRCPLLVECIRHGLRAWRVCDQSSQDRFRAYVRGALAVLPEVLDWRIEIVVDGKTECWNPLEVCVTDWWARHGAQPHAMMRARMDDVSFVSLSPANYRFIVLIRFLVRGVIDLGSIGFSLDELVSRYG